MYNLQLLGLLIIVSPQSFVTLLKGKIEWRNEKVISWKQQKTLHKHAIIRETLFPIGGLISFFFFFFWGVKIWRKIETTTGSLSRWFSLCLNPKCYFSCIDWNKADTVINQVKNVRFSPQAGFLCVLLWWHFKGNLVTALKKIKKYILIYLCITTLKIVCINLSFNYWFAFRPVKVTEILQNNNCIFNLHKHYLHIYECN